MTQITIGDREIGAGHPPFVVAEVGINHNGELDRALEMIHVASRAGCDAVKFQTFKAAEIISDPSQTFTYRSQGREVTESMLAMFRRCELPESAWPIIKAECGKAGILFFSTPQNRSDLEILIKVGVPAVKVGSDDFTNLPLLKSYAQTGLPLILSVGMSDLAEAYQALETVGALDGYPTILMLCTSQYPTPAADVNLRKLHTLRAAFPMVVLGFSDHTQGSMASSLAVGLEAYVFEKHFTLDHDLPGPDHWFSEDPGQLEAWVRSIRTAHTMLGSAVVRPTASELETRKIARRSIVAIRPIARGETFSEENIGVRRPGIGLPPEMLSNVVGARATRSISIGQPILPRDVWSG